MAATARQQTRVRRDLALRLALDARDAAAAEVEQLRAQVRQLEDWLWNAEREVEAMREAVGERDDITMCITPDGHVFAARNVDAQSEAH